MKTCPKCNAINKDKNRFCVECDTYISSTQIIKDESIITDMINKEQKHFLKKIWIVYILVFFFYLMFQVWAAYMCIETYGSITKYLVYLPWYIPCIAIFFFPYDKVYCNYRKKKNKPERHLSDFTMGIFYAIGVLYLYIMMDLIFSMLNTHVEEVPFLMS